MPKPLYPPLKLRHGNYLYDGEVYVSLEAAADIYACQKASLKTRACLDRWRRFSRPRNGKKCSYYAYEDVMASKRARRLAGRPEGAKDRVSRKGARAKPPVIAVDYSAQEIRHG